MQETIESFFQEKADAYRVIDSETGVLTYWRGAQSIPSMKAVSFAIKSSGEELVPNRSEDEFLRFFSTFKPSLNDIENVCELIHWASPFLRRAITSMAPYLRVIESQWHLPSINKDDQFEGFFNNLTKGVVEKIVIAQDFKVTITEVCEGIRM